MVSSFLSFWYCLWRACGGGVEVLEWKCSDGSAGLEVMERRHVRVCVCVLTTGVTDASVTQSALEEALASNMQDGGGTTVGSRMSTFGNAFKSRYLPKGNR
jgi:hypothetical protein